jgi:nitrate reductase gamma subunit
MTTFLWVIVPYVCLAVFVVGHVWRYRYDKFGWTTRSSQLYEDRLLRIGSPLFHFGMLGVVLGHVMGLLVPQSATDAIGLSREAYHVLALVGGIPAGIAAVAGLVILVYRRRTTGPVFSATTVNDKVMYLVLGAVIILGIWNTIAGSVFSFGGHYNYRDGVSPWFRSIFYLQPQPELMASAPIGFKLHALLAFILFAMWPFTRLVHVFSAPIGYLTRPYLVYRSKDERPGRGTGSRAPQRGWEKPELTKK